MREGKQLKRLNKIAPPRTTSAKKHHSYCQRHSFQCTALTRWRRLHSRLAHGHHMCQFRANFCRNSSSKVAKVERREYELISLITFNAKNTRAWCLILLSDSGSDCNQFTNLATDSRYCGAALTTNTMLDPAVNVPICGACFT